MKCPNPDCGHDVEDHLEAGCYSEVEVEVYNCDCNKSRAEIYLALLTEAKEVLEPFAKRGEICNTGWMKDVPDDTKSIIASKYGEYRKASAFLMKLEEK